MFGLVLLVALVLAKITPIAAANVHNLEDEWTYKVQPYKEPLDESSQNYDLATPLKVDISERSVGTWLKEVFDTFKQIPEKISNPFLNKVKELFDYVKQAKKKFTCDICTGIVHIFKQIARIDQLYDALKKDIPTLFCPVFQMISALLLSASSPVSSSASVCGPVADLFIPVVLQPLKLTELGARQICSLFFGETCDTEPPKWDVQFPNVNKPKIIEPALPKPGSKTFKVLHLSDTHYDPDYKVGSPANCKEPLCCRSNSTLRKSEKLVPAGKWGSYEKCDSPKVLLDNMLEAIAKNHPNIDYIIWTGDLPPHNVWEQTKEYNLDIISETVKQMRKYFPKTPIYPAIGNHESAPVGNFPPPWVKNESQSISWLYTKIADHWKKWVPESAKTTIPNGAFYSVLFKKGLRIISLNTNYCHTLSWWLYVNSTDPAGELEWLIKELQEAENKGEKVHIIGHIPPGAPDCMKVWSKNFNAIVERYENTIRGLFYGHTHADEFEVIYDIATSSRPVGVAFLGPSVTPYENNNPAYRIYYVDGGDKNSTLEVIDHETWTFDLEKANKKNNTPKWYKLYSAKDEYKMDALRPKDWDKLLDEFDKKPELFKKFYRHYYRDSPTTPKLDEKRKNRILCDLRSGRQQKTM